MNPKERFLNACQGLAVDRPPVWMMRQAGRTLKEYRKMRETYSFWDLCKSPDLAATVTLQPLKRFPLDAAVIFSDILVVPAAMGMDVQFTPKLALSPRINTLGDLEKLILPDLKRELSYVPEIIQEVRKRTEDQVAVVGFSGAPFTLACYMVEGGSSPNFHSVRVLMNQQPDLFHALMEKVTSVVTEYLLMQVDASPTVVQLFDTWAGELSPGDFEEFVFPYVKRIVQKVKSTGTPVIYFVNGVGNLLELADRTEADVLGIDWRISLSAVRERLGATRCLQGNLDPTVLFSSKERIREAVSHMINETQGQGHIVNLGHGLLPNTPIEGISAFVNSVVETH